MKIRREIPNFVKIRPQYLVLYMKTEVRSTVACKSKWPLKLFGAITSNNSNSREGTNITRKRQNVTLHIHSLASLELVWSDNVLEN
jgi:hypothetical protein